VKVETLGKEGLINAAKTSLSSKLIGPENNLFAPMVVDAMINVRTEDGKHPVKSVHIVKCHGQSVQESRLINGYILEGARAAQGMPLQVKDAKLLASTSISARPRCKWASKS
jgi:T-complex protein 1 subunit alpha